MREYGLTLTKNYVKDWDFTMAVRELIQNGVDQNTVNPKNRFRMDYDPDERRLHFKNSRSILKVNTLLLGRSTKSENDETIGQFGEGYKIAALVLNRMGKEFTIHNNEKKEIWTSAFKKCEDWDGEEILTFFVEETVPTEKGLDIVVGNVSPEEYASIGDIWIGEDPGEVIETQYGKILKDEALKGKVFVNGLYVECSADFDYGYDVKPKYLNLERDRKSCDYYDTCRIVGWMLAEASKENKFSEEEIMSLIESESEDVTRVHDMIDGGAFREAALKKFDEENVESIPVNTQRDYDRAAAFGGRPVFVSTRMMELVSTEAEKRMENLYTRATKEKSPKERLQAWYDRYATSVIWNSKAREELAEIINML